MIDIRIPTLFLFASLCGLIWLAIYKHPDIGWLIFISSVVVFTITFATAAFLMRGK